MKGLFARVWIFCASFVVMFMALVAIALLHVFKLFRRFKGRDPFHNSRQHPLNSPDAPRG